MSSFSRTFSKIRMSELIRMAIGEPSSRWMSDEPAWMANSTIWRARLMVTAYVSI